MITLNGQSVFSMWGDSITQQEWFRYLRKVMAQMYPKTNADNTWILFNDGISAEQVGQIYTNGITSCVRARHPNCTGLILFEGVNDLLSGSPPTPSQFGTEYDTLAIQTTASLNYSPSMTAANVMCISIMGAFDTNRTNLAAFNAQIQTVCTNHGFTYVDIATPYQALIDRGGPDPCQYLGVHPTDTIQTFPAVPNADGGTFSGKEWVARSVIKQGIQFA